MEFKKLITGYFKKQKRTPPKRGPNFINYFGNLDIHSLVLGVIPFQAIQFSPPFDMWYAI